MARYIRIVLARIGGFLFFLILLGLANIFFEHKIVLFFNSQIVFLFVMTILFMIGELFNNSKFPLNLPAPVFNAVGGVLLVIFIFKIFGLIESYVDLALPFNLLLSITIPVVFFIVLIAGYVHIFVSIGKPREKPKSKKKSSKLEWEDVGEEFKQAFYEMARSLKRRFKKK